MAHDGHMNVDVPQNRMVLAYLTRPGRPNPLPAVVTPEEVEDNDNLDLARVAFGFNRRDYGRLRQLIDVLNGL